MLLKRFAYTPMGVFGELHFLDKVWYTCERPWLQNKPNVSCIPVGQYLLQPMVYNRGGYDAVEVCAVPNRTKILIHVGNTMLDSMGCILLGKNLGYVDGKWAVTNSRTAFNEFMELYNKEKPISIIIENALQPGS